MIQLYVWDDNNGHSGSLWVTLGVVQGHFGAFGNFDELNNDKRFYRDPVMLIRKLPHL